MAYLSNIDVSRIQGQQMREAQSAADRARMGAMGTALPGLNFQALYNPAAYGSIPQIPATTTNRQLQNTSNLTLQDMLNTRNTTDRSTTSNWQDTSSVQDTLRNIINNQREVSSWTPNIPGYEGLANASSADVANWLAGRLDPEAIADAASWAANRGITTGLGSGSANAAAAYQHFLGLQRQELQERGLQYYLQLLAQSPRTTTRDVSGSTTETGQVTTTGQMRGGSTTDRVMNEIGRQFGTTTNLGQGETQNIQDNNILQAMYAAAPNPYAAAMANLAAQQMGTSAGAAAGYRAPTMAAPSVSFPRSGPAYERPDTYSTPNQVYGALPTYGGLFGGYSQGSPTGGFGDDAYARWRSSITPMAGPNYSNAASYDNTYGGYNYGPGTGGSVQYLGVGTPGPSGPITNLLPRDEGPSGPMGFSYSDYNTPWGSNWSDADIDAEIASWLGE